MSPWDAVDEAARRMAAEALERLGWRLTDDSRGHRWVAMRKGATDGGICAITAASLVTQVEERVCLDRATQDDEVEGDPEEGVG